MNNVIYNSTPKYLGINLYVENYRILMKEILKALNKWKDIPCSWVRIFNLNMPMTPKLIYKFNTVPIKILAGFFIAIKKLIL